MYVMDFLDCFSTCVPVCESRSSKGQYKRNLQ